MRRLSIKWIIFSLNLLWTATSLINPAVLQAQTSTTPAANLVTITDLTSTSDGSSLITLKMPASVQVGAIRVHTNGTDVSTRFHPIDCPNALCEQATLTSADGLHPGKNVLSVIAGNGVSGRLRFENTATSSNSSLPQLRSFATTTSPQSNLSSGIITPFLPPTISFQTKSNGGWNGQIDPTNNPWFVVGNQGYPVTQPANCGSNVTATYLAVVLDRQTLAEKTTAPESSPQCFANAADLRTYLATLTSSDLAVVGTNLNHSADAGLDTTPIGGTKYPGAPGTSYPAGYMAIGVGGAQAGSAYEPYYFNQTGYEQVNPFAVGTLQEDAYGNYNFQSSDVIEYAVSPNDPGYLTQATTSVVSLGVVPSLVGAVIKRDLYTPPTGANGYWLLIVSRYSLNSKVPCDQGPVSADGSSQLIPNCGTFYPTGSSDPSTSAEAYRQLANDLNSVNSWQLAFLTTVGQAAYGGIWSVGGYNSSSPASTNGFMEFSQAVQRLNGSPNLTLSLGTQGSAYTLISAPGNGGPLNGQIVESTTVLSAQGQTGLVHGILQRNLNGLFLPAQTSQETKALFAAKGGVSSSDFKLTEIALQQPSDWPSSSQKTLLSGASSLSGQLAAYRYLSWVLLNNIYMKGIQGPHQDDIHYFFTGSSNTFINYHTYDPTVISWPDGTTAFGPYVSPCNSITGPNLDICTSNIFGTNDPLVFTLIDFLAVRNQLSLEVRYLTDTLQFMVNGSTNLKDVIAAGNSNVGIALTGAAATILSSKLVSVPPTTTVGVSWQNIVSMIGGVSSLLSAVPGLGEIAGVADLATTGAKIFGGTANAVGGAASLAAGAGGITSTNTSNSLPSAFSKFSARIGDLANGSMQGQLSTGFDTITDSITSDWGRISTIGPMVVDSNNSVFYSPNQVAQNVAVAALTQASSRSFYLALMPSFYNIQYWQGVMGDAVTPSNNYPDMGYFDDTFAGANTCSAYYLNPQQPNSNLGTAPPNTYVYYPSSGGTLSYFDKSTSNNPADFYVIAGATTGAGGDSPQIALLSANLADNLFTTTGLNLPIDEFVTPGGPMSTVFDNAHDKNPASHTAPTVCNARFYPQPGSTQTGVGTTPGTATTTTLSVPTTSVLGENVVLSAKVKAGPTPVTAGQMYFLDNGVYLSTVPMDATGTATATWTGLSLGQHSIQAKYSSVDPYKASSSTVASLGVYANAPDLSLSISNSNLQVTYGATSSPITLQVTSLAGLAGTVNLTCSGLPVGMTCAFNPAQVTLIEGTAATASMTISGTAQKAGMLSFEGIGGLLLLPLSLLCLTRIRKGARSIPALLFLLLISAVSIGSLAGCSGGATDSFKETGSKTILVIASTGSVTKSIPVLVNIQ
jgi:hypothetical protein